MSLKWIAIDVATGMLGNYHRSSSNDVYIQQMDRNVHKLLLR